MKQRRTSYSCKSGKIFEDNERSMRIYERDLAIKMALDMNSTSVPWNTFLIQSVGKFCVMLRFVVGEDSVALGSMRQGTEGQCEASLKIRSLIRILQFVFENRNWSISISK